MKTKILEFLAETPPFDVLPSSALAEVAEQVEVKSYPADTLLCRQGETRLQHLYLIAKGAVELFFEENGVKRLKGILSEGESFGGIALLVNGGYAIRSIRVIEATEFYLLPEAKFLALCRDYPAFSDFFTGRFGKNLLDKSYRAVVSGIAGQQSTVDLPLYMQSVASATNYDLLTAPFTASIQSVARLMNSRSRSSVLLTDESDKIIGIVTDKDFRQKVAAENLDVNLPVRHIMSSPIISVSEDAQVLEAIMRMVQHNIKHLAVTDAAGNVVGITSNQRLLLAQRRSPVNLIREIRSAGHPEELAGKQLHLAPVVKDLIAGGARSDYLNRMITAVADSILTRLLEMALDRLGAPPVPFAFMIMGSEGRKEQTLKTDQDNAIIYQNPVAEEAETCQAYFLQLGELVCRWLNDAGYKYCNGNIMAQNPQWCQPISVWKEYFYQWIRVPEPKAVMHSTIFFDFNYAFGDASLTRELRAYLFKLLDKRVDTFFYHLVSNSLQIKPPLGFFRNFVVESKGEHKNMFDIKKAMTPIVDFARIYALKYKIAETNTLQRLEKLQEKGVINSSEFNELEQAYRFLMQARLVRQVKAITEENREPDNYINPETLTQIEQRMLKEVFSLIQDYQEKLSIHFKGII